VVQSLYDWSSDGTAGAAVAPTDAV
jgi:hypothetical protein